MHATDNPTFTRDIQRVTASATLTDAPYRRVHRQSLISWQPRSIHITFQRSRTNGGEWGGWTTDGAVLRGPRIKNDGTDGVQEHTENWIQRNDETYGEWITAQRQALPKREA